MNEPSHTSTGVRYGTGLEAARRPLQQPLPVRPLHQGPPDRAVAGLLEPVEVLTALGGTITLPWHQPGPGPGAAARRVQPRPAGADPAT